MVPMCKDISVGLTPYSRWRPGVCHGHGMKARHGMKPMPSRKTSMGRTRKRTNGSWIGFQNWPKSAAAPETRIALARLLHKEPVVSPIIGSYRMSHLEDALDAVSVRLSPEEMTFLEELYIPHPIQGHH